MPNLNYSHKDFSGAINSISDIEDLEYTKVCRFYFYKHGTVEANGIQAARDFKFGEDKTRLFQEVTKKKEECTPNRYHYIDVK